MSLSLSVDLRLGVSIHPRFLAMLQGECGRKVAFPVLASEPERRDVVEFPFIPRADRATREMADSAMTFEDADANSVWDFLVVMFCDPFINRSQSFMAR